MIALYNLLRIRIFTFFFLGFYLSSFFGLGAVGEPWFVRTGDLVHLETATGAPIQILDARGNPFRFLKPIPNSILVSWDGFTQEAGPARGKLVSKSEVLTRLAKKNIYPSGRFLVIGDPVRGWGEEGRIAWMLREVGFSEVFILDGGVREWMEFTGGTPKKKVLGISLPIQNKSKLQSAQSKRLDIDADEIRIHRKDGNFVLIDTREPREFEGSTPYGEKRGGHIPGAVALYYKELLDSNGKILPEARIHAILQKKGISKDKKIVAYCTGGVRSAWLTAVLRDLGFDARNYSGSMWEWSSLDPNLYPLVSGED